MGFTVTANTPTLGHIAWTNAHIVYEGINYPIVNGSTERKFVCWVKSNPAVFLTTNTYPVLGADDCIVFLNKGGVPISVLTATATEGDLVVPGTITSTSIATDTIDASHIRSDAVIARHILAGSITAEKLSVANLSAISANLGTMTAGNFTLNADGFIRGGAANFNSGTGFWMGNDAGLYKFRAGTPGSSRMEWNGTAFNIFGPDGNITISSGVVDYSRLANQPQSLGDINTTESTKLGGIQSGATRNVFRGDWTVSTVYAVGDTVLASGHGWACIAAHTAAAGNQPPTDAATTSNVWWTRFANRGADGTSAISVLVSNEAHVFPATSAGVVSLYTGSGTDIQVFDGIVALNAVASITANGQFTIGAPTQVPAAVLTVGARTYAGTTATVAQHGAMLDGTDAVVVSYPISIRRTNGTLFNTTVAQSFSKSRAGATGAPGAPGAAGANARVAFLSATSQVFQVSKTGVTTPASITLTASGQNVAGSPTFTVIAGTATLTGTGNTRAIAPASMTTDSATVQITWDGQTDTITIVRVREGIDGAAGTNGTNGLSVATAYIYRRSATAPATAPALPTTNVTFTFSGGAITGLDNGWTATVPAGTDPLYVATGVASGLASTATIAPASWSTPTILAQNGTVGATGAAGAAGLNSATVYLFQRTATAAPPALPSVSTTYTFSSGVATGQNNGWVTSMPTTGGAFRWMTTASASSAGASDTIANTEWSAAALLAEDGAAGANGAPGTDGLTVVFSNESHTVPASSAGVVSSYVGSGTTVQVFEGTTPLSAVATIAANSQFTVGAPTLAPAASMVVGAISHAGTTATVVQHSGMPDATDVSTITFPISVRRANGTTVNLSRTQTITKSRAGAVGSTGAAGAAGVAGANGLNFSEAQSLFTDTTFQHGNNGLHIYNNYGNGTVTHTREARQLDSPFTDSGFNIRISNTGAATPGIGGFIQLVMSRPNAVFVQRIVAKIPVGYWIGDYSNPTGDGATNTWITSQNGTGRFEEYLLVRRCGSTGTFSSTGHIAIHGPNGSVANPVSWHIAYAAVYDFTAPGIAPTVTVTGNRALTFTSTDGVLDASQENVVLTATTSGIGSPAFVWTFNGFAVAPTNSGASTQTITAANIGAARSATVTCTVNGAFVDQVTITRLDRSTAAAGATVGANESNLQMGVGGNLLRNSDLLMSDAHWVGGWASAPGGTTIAQRNIAGLDWSPFGGNTFGINRASFTPTGVWDFGNSARIPVVPGTRYEASAFLASHRCMCVIFLLFHNSSGAQVGDFHSAQINAHGGQSLSNWSRALVFAVAPPTAAWVTFHVRSHATGQNDPYTWVFQPFVGVAGAMQTVASRWAPGNFAEQITPANASTFIANAAIGSAQIGSIALVGTSNFSVRTATTGARMEMDSRAIKIFDASGVLRVQLGDLTV